MKYVWRGVTLSSSIMINMSTRCAYDLREFFTKHAYIAYTAPLYLAVGCKALNDAQVQYETEPKIATYTNN